MTNRAKSSPDLMIQADRIRPRPVEVATSTSIRYRTPTRRIVPASLPLRARTARGVRAGCPRPGPSSPERTGTRSPCSCRGNVPSTSNTRRVCEGLPRHVLRWVASSAMNERRAMRQVVGAAMTAPPGMPVRTYPDRGPGRPDEGKWTGPRAGHRCLRKFEGRPRSPGDRGYRTACKHPSPPGSLSSGHLRSSACLFIGASQGNGRKVPSGSSEGMTANSAGQSSIGRFKSSLSTASVNERPIRKQGASRYF